MEQWKKIQDEPMYSVSSKGSIKNNQTDHIKSLRLDKDGYQRVTLYPSGKTYKVHSLVMKNFTPKSKWKEQINHKDLNKQNNELTNLEWNTPKENIRHYYKNGNVPSRKGENGPSAKLNQSQVEEIVFKLYKKQSIKSLSEEYGVSTGAIEHIKYGDTW